MKYLALLASTMLLPVAGHAQTAPATGAEVGAGIAVGATVYGPKGEIAGKVDSVTPQTVVINTGTNRVGLPRAALQAGAKGPVVNMTKAQLDAASKGAPTAGAQANGAVAVGATVYGPQGEVAGTIDSITPQAVVINTGTNKVGVPPTAVGRGIKGPVVSMTKAQLDAAYQQAATQSNAQLQAQLTPGAQVFGSEGTAIGTVKMADAQFVTLTTPTGEVKLPANGFAVGPNGIQIGMTAAQLSAAIAQAGGGTAATVGAGAASTTPPTSTGAMGTATAAPGTTATTTDPSTGAAMTSTTGGTTQSSVDSSAAAAANSGAPDNATTATTAKKKKKKGS